MTADGFAPYIRMALALVGLIALGSTGCDRSMSDNDVPPFVLQTLLGDGPYELLSLDPSHHPIETQPATTQPAATQPSDLFHGYRVLGRTMITDKQTRQELNDALRRGAQENSGMAAGCFNPRHGLHVISKGQTLDLVICFECMAVNAYNGDQQMQFLISDSPKSTFDDVLTAAHVPLPGETK